MSYRNIADLMWIAYQNVIFWLGNYFARKSEGITYNQKLKVDSLIILLHYAQKMVIKTTDLNFLLINWTSRLLQSSCLLHFTIIFYHFTYFRYDCHFLNCIFNCCFYLTPCWCHCSWILTLSSFLLIPPLEIPAWTV